MPSRVPITADRAPLVGDPRELTARLGISGLLSPDPANPRAVTMPGTATELRRFILHYRDTILGPQELPAILQACTLANQGHARDLIQLDQEWTTTSRDRCFKEASLSVGRRQLGRLRPMRDHRVIQRYADAVDSGIAMGWHVIVYGIALSVFSVPQRSGLLHYAQMTLGSFLDSAPTSAQLTDGDKREIRRELEAAAPEILAKVLPTKPTLRAI